jgi:Flp pilus assembly protein TadD
VQRVRRTGKVLFVLGAGLFSLALTVGAIQSLLIERRLPAIDLFNSGSQAYIDGLLAQKDYDGAIQQLRMQLRMLSGDFTTHEKLGILLDERGRTDEARSEFQELVRLRPDYAEGHFHLGINYQGTEEWALAAASFAKAIRLKPEFPLAINSLGVAMAQMGKLREAEACFARAVEIAPDYGEAQSNLDKARRLLRRQ